MDELFRWAITTAVGILCIFVGRAWGKNDARIQKDNTLLEILLSLMPIDGRATELLRVYDFGGDFEDELIDEIIKFYRYCIRPDVFFLNKGPEKSRQQLVDALKKFIRYVSRETFLSDSRPGYRLIPNITETIISKERHIQYQMYGDRPWAELSDDERKELSDATDGVEDEVIKHRQEIADKLNMQSTQIIQIYDKLISQVKKLV